MHTVARRAAVILKGLPLNMPSDAVTLQAMLLAAVAACYEAGLSRADVLQTAGRDWDAIDEILQAASASASPNPCAGGRSSGTIH